MKNTAKTLFAVLIAIFALVSATRAGPYEEAFAAYDRGDYATAIPIYRLLADQGDAYAQRALGIMYDMGQGVPQDYVEAMKWYRRAADQGDALAQNNAGLLHLNGSGVPQNYIQAYMWLSLAAANALDKDGRDLAARNRELAASRMTPAEIGEAKKLAAEWRPKLER
jgi:uncharacterized protein